MPTKKPQYLMTFPTPEAYESVRQRAKEAGLSLNNYILRELKIEQLKHGGVIGNKGNKFGRKGKPAKDKKL